MIIKRLHNTETKKYRFLLLRYKITLLAVLLFVMSGCSYCQQGAKTFINGREQSIAKPLRQVMLISGRGLEDLNLTITRMEFLDQGRLIQATGYNTEVNLRFDPLTRSLTRLHGKAFTKQGIRDFSSEKVVFNHISELLSQDNLPDLRKMTAKMIPVYQSSDTKSRVIAYLACGVVVTTVEGGKKWKKIELVSGGTGYVLTANLKPAPPDSSPSTGEDLRWG